MRPGGRGTSLSEKRDDSGTGPAGLHLRISRTAEKKRRQHAKAMRERGGGERRGHNVSSTLVKKCRQLIITKRRRTQPDGNFTGMIISLWATGPLRVRYCPMHSVPAWGRNPVDFASIRLRLVHLLLSAGIWFIPELLIAPLQYYDRQHPSRPDHSGDCAKPGWHIKLALGPEAPAAGCFSICWWALTCSH